MFTVLADRKLWYDGESTVHPSAILELIQQGVSPVGLCVDYLTDDIKQYNKFCKSNEQINIKQQSNPLKFNWVLPDPYSTMDIDVFLQTKIAQYFKDRNITNPMLITSINNRVQKELELYKARDKLDVLRAMVYIVDTLTLNNVVWGVGRGSSVSSFVLYLIGVHDVDCIQYKLDIADFLS